MAKRKQKESDQAFFLKLVLFLILGSLWVRYFPNENTQIPVPVGLVVGLAFASHDHFKIDRKIEYALLLVAMFVSFWLPIGIYIT